METLSSNYLTYCGGLRNAVKLLTELREFEEFERFVKVSQIILDLL